jgi:hypothetical protein
LTSGSGDLFDRNTHKWFAPSLLVGFELMENLRGCTVVGQTHCCRPSSG